MWLQGGGSGPQYNNYCCCGEDRNDSSQLACVGEREDACGGNAQWLLRTDCLGERESDYCCCGFGADGSSLTCIHNNQAGCGGGGEWLLRSDCT